MQGLVLWSVVLLAQQQHIDGWEAAQVLHQRPGCRPAVRIAVAASLKQAKAKTKAPQRPERPAQRLTAIDKADGWGHEGALWV
jgi:hypothetical protein